MAKQECALTFTVLGVFAARGAGETVQRAKQGVHSRLFARLLPHAHVGADRLAAAGAVAATAGDSKVLGCRLSAPAAGQQMLGGQVARPQIASAPHAVSAVAFDELGHDSHHRER
jgi:hypothetical protein